MMMAYSSTSRMEIEENGDCGGGDRAADVCDPATVVNFTHPGTTHLFYDSFFQWCWWGGSGGGSCSRRRTHDWAFFIKWGGGRQFLKKM